VFSNFNKFLRKLWNLYWNYWSISKNHEGTDCTDTTTDLWGCLTTPMEILLTATSVSKERQTFQKWLLTRVKVDPLFFIDINTKIYHSRYFSKWFDISTLVTLVTLVTCCSSYSKLNPKRLNTQRQRRFLDLSANVRLSFYKLFRHKGPML
jgi:hypothetical protein